MNSDFTQQGWTKVKWMGLVPLFIGATYLFLGLLWQPLPEIFQGLGKIATSPSQLATDYFAIGGVGATLWNSAFIILLELLIIYQLKADITGGVIAAIFLTSGYSFMGTTILNFLPIFLGVYLYTLIGDLPLRDHLATGFLASSLGPLVDIIVFGLDMDLHIALPLAMATGLLVGYIVLPLAEVFKAFHKGYNIYNVGFVAGVIGLGFVSVFRLFAYKIDPVGLISNLDLTKFVGVLLALFIAMALLGYILNGRSLKSYWELLREESGLDVDFYQLYGVGPTLMNMGFMGLIALVYLFLTGAPFNGIVLCAVVSVAGFGAVGKQPKNGIPLILGVYLATILNPGYYTPTAAANCALLSTAGAPLAGDFGFGPGVLSGFLHAAILGNLTILHGGVNLYNNGFSIGFVAAIMVPLLIFHRERSRKDLPLKEAREGNISK